MALVQVWPDWHLPVYVAIIFGAGQILEGYVLSPRLVGGSVGLHPVWLMFALLAAGSLFGFIGLLVAVPVAAAIGVLVRFGLSQYLASPLYTGGPVDADYPGRPGMTASTTSSKPPPVPRQLALDLPARTSFSREDFLVSPSNEAAYGLIERWPDWPARRALLVGPKGSGKSHLAAIWSEMAAAAIVDAATLREDVVPDLIAVGAVVLEDAGRGVSETALFHLLNLAGEAGASLITAHEPPGSSGASICRI